MKNNFWMKLLQFLAVISFVVFFGIGLARSVIFYDIVVLNPESNLMIERTDLTPDLLFRSVFHYFAMSAYSSIAYIVLFLSVIMILMLNKKIIKQKGWLLMITILILLFSPFELWNVYSDIKVSYEIFFNQINSFGSEIIQNYFKYRMNNILSVFSGLSFLTQLTIIVLLVFKPLDKSDK